MAETPQSKAGNGQRQAEQRITQLTERIEILEQFVQKHSAGGMLSSTDFFNLRVPEGKYEDFEKNFREAVKNNKWDENNNALFTDIDRDGVKLRKARLLIKPFDIINVTPFSYDLTIGGQICSLRKEVREITVLAEDEPYKIQPRETIIVSTKEYIALPPTYAATVWPRFGPVSEGIFQSMVKIDPTWAGILAVALTNVSPAVYPLYKEQLFATLIVYELTQPTKFVLCNPEQVKSIPAKLPAALLKKYDKAKIEEALSGKYLNKVCEVHENDGGDVNLLIKKGLRNKREYSALTNLFPEREWRETILATKQRVVDLEKIGKAGYGMEDLSLILMDPPTGKRLRRNELNKEPDLDTLETTAIEYGGPCRWLPIMPKLIEQEAKEKIQSDIEANLFPKLVALTLTVLGMLSVIIAVIGILAATFHPESIVGKRIDWPISLVWANIGLGGLVVICLIILLKPQLSRWLLDRSRNRNNRNQD